LLSGSSEAVTSYPDERLQSSGQELEVLIVGSGFGGICAGIKLLQAGIGSFLILERAEAIGGTWRDNDYPGCACDVPSHLYSFSFEPNPFWTRLFAVQAEIRSYLEHCAHKYGILPHIRCGENVERAEYDEGRASWTVRTSSGNVYRARVLISAMGPLSNPAYPDLPGREAFAGRAFHSARWDHSYDLTGKRVAVIGTGASAIQFIPQIAPKVAELQVYQRTPPWILPKPDREIPERAQRLFQRFPWLQRLLRGLLYCLLEVRALGFTRRPKLLASMQRQAQSFIEQEFADPELRRRVTPDYGIGCKRILISDDFYPTLRRPNVALIATAIREIRAHSIITHDGIERPIDALIYGTGFSVLGPMAGGVIFGRGGHDLAEGWSETGAEAYKGTCIAGFPNLFLIAGPNSGLGHNSIIYMIESQVTYILDALRQMRQKGWISVEPKPEVQAAYNLVIQDKHQHSVWSSGCKSWYLDARGKNTAIWPGFSFSFRRQTARFDAGNYRIETAAAYRDTPGASRVLREAAVRAAPGVTTGTG
jgi:cation diffusion facilitator CzcD-associated flavoprotein CzcO